MRDFWQAFLTTVGVIVAVVVSSLLSLYFIEPNWWSWLTP